MERLLFDFHLTFDVSMLLQVWIPAINIGFPENLVLNRIVLDLLLILSLVLFTSKAIPFSLPKASHVKLVVYDMLGRQIDTIVDGELSAGYHNATFDASRYPSGTYVYRIATESFSATHKMVLVK